MTTIMPDGDGVKKAITWIDEVKSEQPDKKLTTLIDDAGMKFNLSPKDSDFLFRFYTKKD